jgi:hypothetical protein
MLATGQPAVHIAPEFVDETHMQPHNGYTVHKMQYFRIVAPVICTRMCQNPVTSRSGTSATWALQRIC